MAEGKNKMCATSTYGNTLLLCHGKTVDQFFSYKVLNKLNLYNWKRWRGNFTSHSPLTIPFVISLDPFPCPFPAPSEYRHGFWSYIEVRIVFVTICTIRSWSFFPDKVHAFFPAPVRRSTAQFSPCCYVVCGHIIYSVISRCWRPSESSPSFLITTFTDRVFLILQRGSLACLLIGWFLRILFNRRFQIRSSTIALASVPSAASPTSKSSPRAVHHGRACANLVVLSLRAFYSIYTSFVFLFAYTRFCWVRSLFLWNPLYVRRFTSYFISAFFVLLVIFTSVLTVAAATRGIKRSIQHSLNPFAFNFSLILELHLEILINLHLRLQEP